jgi:hypothetical protein
MGDYSIGFINKDGVLTNPIANVYYSGAFFPQGSYTTTLSKAETIAGLGIDTADKTANNYDPIVISTPLSRSDYTYVASDNKIPVNCGATGFGYYDGLGFKYTEPTGVLRSQRYPLYGNNSAATYVTIAQKPSLCRRFTTRYSKTNTDNYGVYVYGQYGSGYGLVLDHSKAPLLLHRTTGGKVLATGTANSYPPGSDSIASKSFGSIDIAGNVIFPKPFTDPPLIFITYSSGPIALYSMNKDANGKYVSATLICDTGRKADPNTATLGFSWVGLSKSATFTYFIVSEEVPTTVSTDNFGMRVYDSTGTKVLFRNDYEIPAMSAELNGDIYRVASFPSGGYSTNISWYEQAGIIATSGGSNIEGICINNYPCVNQLTSYEYLVMFINSTQYIRFACILSGIYLQVLSGSYISSALETNMFTNFNSPNAAFSVTFGQAGVTRPILRASYQPL